MTRLLLPRCFPSDRCLDVCCLGVSYWLGHVVVGLLFVVGAVAHADDKVDFQREIRPVLAEHCLACHGLDESAREADLRLDNRDAALQSEAIVPGKPDASELMARVSSGDPDLRMPPADHGEPLAEEQVATLRRWIEQGAEYTQHWAFQPPRRPVSPVVQHTDWLLNEIDPFVLARLEAAGLQPAARADRYTLARRLYLDLTGLPPTPEQAEAFVQDQRPSAYQRLVDHLLSSPAYGERWARPWLDLARYSDTNGYEKDRPRSIWPYRDWVIRALNADTPYDQFSIEQLAGDMLPHATDQQRIATGFHRNTMLNEEGGIDPLEFRFYAMVDRVATTGLVWMGLTTGCAQCHSHKYDPISHTDYYSLMALLNNADEPDLLISDPAVLAKRKSLEEEIAALEEKLPEQFPGGPAKDDGDGGGSAAFDAAFEKWLAREAQHAVAWHTVRPTQWTTNLPRLEVLSDGSIFSTGDITKRDVFTLDFDLDIVAGLNDSIDSDKPITAIRLEILPDDRLPAGGPGRAYYEGRKGDFFLSEWSAKVIDGDAAKPLEFAHPSHSYGKLSIGSGNANADNVLDGNGSTGWSTSGGEGKPHQLVLPLQEPLAAKGRLQVTMLFERHFAASLGRFRIAITTDEPQGGEGELDKEKPKKKNGGNKKGGEKKGGEKKGGEVGAPPNEKAVIRASAFPTEVEALLAKDANRSSEERTRLRRYFAQTTPQLAKARQPIDLLRKSLPALPATMVMQERPADNVRPTHRHHRGEYLSPKDKASPGLPAFFASSSHASSPAVSNRLELARWLVSERNPLVARVAVNRAWREFWGVGLVRTSGDFGAQSDLPTHPQLLDLLATKFMESWSLKQLHRTIVLSAAYQQASAVTAERHAADPNNRLLSRGPRFRLPAEAVRDATFHRAGLLTRKVGGPSVYPPQPPSVTALAYGGGKWPVSSGADRFRRSLYTFSKRTAPFAAYAVFDAPSGELCTAKRDRSNTPLQALTTLNDGMFVEAAQRLGADTDARQGASKERLTWLFRQVLTRPPSDKELTVLLDYFDRQRYRLEKEELDAKAIGGGSVSQSAWTLTARVLLNLDEALTKP